MFDDELATVPAHPPRTGVLPGMRLNVAVPRSALILLIAFCVLFAVLPLSIISTDPKMKLSFGPNRTAAGRVLSVADVAGCRSSSAHRIVYVFSADSGTEFRGAALLCEESPYHVAQAGDKIEVRYLTRDPAVNAVVSTNLDNEPPVFVFMIFPLFFLVVFAPLFLPQLREVMRARRLYKSGALITGKVVFVKKRNATTWPGWPGSSSADVYVAYQLPSGARAETVTSCMNEWLVNQLSPGATVHILVPPDSSARGVLLEAYIR